MSERECDELRARIEELRKERDEAVAAFHDATRLRSQIQEARIKAENERDEAHAEAERLRRVLKDVPHEPVDRTEYVVKIERERDEARAEAVRLFSARHTSFCERQSAYNVGCVCGASEILRSLLREVAEKQREACASAVRLWELDPSIGARSWHAHDAARAATLVTDEESVKFWLYGKL